MYNTVGTLLYLVKQDPNDENIKYRFKDASKSKLRLIVVRQHRILCFRRFSLDEIIQVGYLYFHTSVHRCVYGVMLFIIKLNIT